MVRNAALLAAALLSSAPALALEIASPDLKDGDTIAKEQVYTRCGGANVSPAISWSGVPKEARSLALTAIDISVKPNGWSHWVVVDLPPTTMSLAKGASHYPQGARVLVSDFGDPAYGGPCPPKGSGPHRYEFTVWALPDATIPVSDGSAKIGGWLAAHAIAHATLTGIYEIK